MKQGRKKSGNLSSGSKEPPFRGGLDWEAIRHGNRPKEEWGEPIPEKLQLSLEDIDRRNRGVNTYYGDEKQKAEQRDKARRKGRVRAAPFDVDEVVELYVGGMGVSELALKISTSPETVRRYLRKAKVYEPNRDKHRPHRPAETYSKKDRCIRDHDLTVEGARYANGACRECKRERDYHNVPWAEDPRNPKNGGDSGWTEERKERQNLKRARDRLACPNESCGHAGLKHQLGCGVRDCRCQYTISDIKGLWAQITDEVGP